MPPVWFLTNIHQVWNLLAFLDLKSAICIQEYIPISLVILSFVINFCFHRSDIQRIIRFHIF